MTLITIEKTDEFEYININIPCSSKDTIMRAKRQTRVGKDVRNTHNSQRTHFPSVQRTLRNQKKIKFSKKWAKNLSKSFKKRLMKCPLSIRKGCQLH